MIRGNDVKLLLLVIGQKRPETWPATSLFMVAMVQSQPCLRLSQIIQALSAAITLHPNYNTYVPVCCPGLTLSTLSQSTLDLSASTQRPQRYSYIDSLDFFLDKATP